MPHSSHESEWLTRKKRIDPKLKALGWKVVSYQEDELTKQLGHIDFTLSVRDPLFQEFDRGREQPMLLDPCCEADPALLWFDEDGQPRPNPTLCGPDDSYLTRRVTASIRLYHLDHVDLVERRATLCRRIQRETEHGDRMLQKMQQGDMTAREALASTMSQLRQDINERSELSATAKAMLKGLRATSPTAEAVLTL